MAWASSPCARPWAIPPRGQQVAHLVEVIVLIRAHSLGLLKRRLRPLDGNPRDGRFGALEVMTIRALDYQLDGPATAVGEHTAVGPPVRSRDRSGSCRPSPPAGRWSSLHPWPAMSHHPLPGLVGGQATCPQRQAYTRCRPRSETAMRRATSTDAGVMQGLPLAPSAEHEGDGNHRLPIIDARPMAPQRCGLRGGTSGWMHSHHSSGIRHSRPTVAWSVCIAHPSVLQRMNRRSYTISSVRDARGDNPKPVCQPLNEHGAVKQLLLAMISLWQ